MTITEKYKPYSKYKNSGIEWIGEIPEGWEVKRLKYCAKTNMGQSPNSDKCNLDGNGLPFLQGNAEFGALNPNPKYFCDEPRKIAKKEEILLSVRAPVGAMNIADHNYCIGRGLCSIKVIPNRLDNKFAWYLLYHIRNELKLYSTGSTYEAVSASIVNNLTSILPSQAEQSQIASFLDHETSRIDNLILKKKQQIELLQEKRSGLITHAVTKGLNPNAKMKDSGIEWIGEIPEGWDVNRLKHVFRNMDYRRVPLSAEQRSYMEKKYPYYGASGVIDAVDDYLFDEPLLLVAEDGANLLSRSTPLAFIAKGKYWVNNHAHILKPILGNIIYWEGVMQSFDYTPLISGAAQPKLTAENLSNIFLPVPSSTEQLQIADYLDKETSKIDTLISKIQLSIEKLKEYRTALISAAVTGKIDVREWNKEN